MIGSLFCAIRLRTGVISRSVPTSVGRSVSATSVIFREQGRGSGGGAKRRTVARLG